MPSMGADLRKVDASTAHAVDEAFASFQASHRSPGMTYGIVTGGGVVHAGATGVASNDGRPLNARSVLRIASMTKSFTAAVILLLRDEGLLRLDDPVSTYVPELARLRLPTPDSPPPTLRMLLTMSGGLPNDDPWADREESMSPAELSALLEAGISFSSDPGTDFQYSNLGYVIAGRVIANVSGESYHDVVRTRLLEPLGLRSTGFARAEVPAMDLVPGHHRLDEAWHEEPFTEPGEFSPLGGLFSTVDDLAVWVGGFTEALAERGDVATGRHPLSRASRREMQQLQRFIEVTVPAARPGTPPVRARASGYGLGLVVTHDTRWGQIVGHSGGYPGYGSHMRWHVATGIGVIALGNGRYVPASEPAAAALEIVLAAAEGPSRRVTRWPRTRELQRVVESLLERWDDAVADSIFAANVDADLSRERRRTAAEAVSRQLGAITGRDGLVVDSAAEVTWWVTGAYGRARLHLQLTPEAVPRVQELEIAFVGAVDPALEWAAAAAAASIAGGDVEVEIQCVEWRSRHDATFRIRTGVDQWTAAIAVHPESGAVTTQVVTPTPPTSSRFQLVADREDATDER